jgi:hypothetical protein
MMPGYLLVVVLGLVLAFVGFNMAFRQDAVRRLLGRPVSPRSPGDGEDPLTYALRISGVMIMIFGVAIGGMVTIVHFAS